MKPLSLQKTVPARAWGLLLLTLALAMVLAVAACESEDDPTATPGSGETSSGTEQTSQPSGTGTGSTAGTDTGSSQTGSSGDTQMDQEPLQVVTTSNIVADWIRNVGGDRVEVTSLLPVGGDPHTYQPGARDVAQIVDADLVFTVGLQLEGQWLEELIHNASADESKIIALAELIDPIPLAETGGHQASDPDHEDEEEHHDDDMDEEEGHDDDEDMDEEEGHDDDEEEHHDEDEDMDEGEDHEEGEDEDHDEDEDEDHGEEEEHGHGELDPHFWFDPGRVKAAVIEIATRLAMMDTAGVETYTANATAYVAQLEELHGWTEQQVSAIPVDNRILVTSHDSLSYFAVLYGFEIVGTVIPSGTTETESSAEQLAELIEIIEHEGVPAVFGETTVSDRIARAVAEETGAGFYNLYSGSLGAAGSEADTYLTMVRSNVEVIAEALS